MAPSGWGAHKKPLHGDKIVGTCAHTTMAPDVPTDNMMVDHDRLEDHNNDERGESIKQSIGVYPDKEPVSHKHF